MSLRLSKKTGNDTAYDGLVKTLRQEDPGHLTGFLIHTVPPTLSDIGKKRKVLVLTIAPLEHIHIRDNTAKKQESLASASASKYPVAFKRPFERRDAASTSEPPVHPTRKRRLLSPSRSPDDADGDSAPSKKKRLPAPVQITPRRTPGPPSTAPAPALPNSQDRPS